jgi:YD repeat-containing protein
VPDRGAPGGASECGDLRLAHALPAVRTLNQARAPVLLYNSEHASPHPVVAANVRLPSGTLGLRRVVATLKVEGTPRARSVWNGGDWPGGDAARIAVAYDAAGDRTRAYRYTLEVAATYLTGTTADTVRGQLAVVNRRASRFGAGWWMAGVEELVMDVGGGPVLWVGGDGSTRRYTAARGDSVWGAPSLDRPDTLKRVGLRWVRLLPGRGRVEFDALGRHVRTVNRLGHAAEFQYDSLGRLEILRMSPVEMGMRHRLHYGADQQLDSITSPANGSVRRVTRLARRGMRLDSIVSPDTSTVRFGYLDATSPIVASRTDARGATAWYRFDGGRRIASARVDAGPGDSIVTRLRSGATLGLANAGGALSLDSAHARMDGPRNDVADITRIWLDRWGGPRRVINAAGDRTTVFRENPAYPALATRTISPTGVVTLAHYNALGLPDTTRVLSPLGDARDAVTVYEYGNAAWPELPTRTVAPTGEEVRVGYDTATGNRIWQEDGRGESSRVRFFYGNAFGQVTSTQTPLQAQAGKRDSVEYDSGLGNMLATTSVTGVRTYMDTDGIGQVVRVRTPIDSLQTLFQKDTTAYSIGGRVLWTRRIGPALSYARPELWQEPTGEVPAETLTVRNVYDGRRDLIRVERWATPDVAGVGVLRNGFEYDAIGRKVAEIDAWGNRDRTHYDGAGNVVAVSTRRRAEIGDSTMMRYDALNRLTRRVVPRVSYNPLSVDNQFPPQTTDPMRFPLFGTDANWNPTIRNTGGSGLVIKADTSVFTYDSTGMRTADNGDARVSRSYYPNGLLRTEVQRIRTYVGADFSQHAYTSTYEYDVSGRRTLHQYPRQLAIDAVGLEYDPVTGALSTVSDSDAHSHQYGYDLDGRVESLLRADNIQERWSYDEEGRLARRWEAPVASPGTLVHSDTFRYDVRGKVLEVRSLADSTGNGYSGLGNLVWSYQYKKYPRTRHEETYDQDALGNTRRVRRASTDPKTDLPGVEFTDHAYETGTGRLRWTQPLNGQRQLSGARDTSAFDLAGNRVFHMSFKEVSHAASHNGKASQVEAMKSYYGADNKLRVVDRQACAYAFTKQTFDGALSALWPTGGYKWTCFTPYSYRVPHLRGVPIRRAGPARAGAVAAQGRVHRRRVPRRGDAHGVGRRPHPPRDPRARRAHGGGHGCGGGGRERRPAHRAGDLRVRGGAGPAAGAVPCGVPPAVSRADPHRAARQLARRLRHGDPRRTARAAVQGAAAGQSGRPRGGGRRAGFAAGHGARPPHYVCMVVEWPAAYLWMSHLSRENTPAGPAELDGEPDPEQAGSDGPALHAQPLLRPADGALHPGDPIGLAGGLNAYGFADGDPVSYSDPYGLQPDGNCLLTPAVCIAVRMQQPAHIAGDVVVEVAGVVVDVLGNTLWGLATVGHCTCNGSLGPAPGFRSRTDLLEHRATGRGARPGSDRVDVDMDHIANRHMPGGAEVTPQKTLFSVNWSRRTVESAVREAYRNAKVVRAQGDRVLMEGTSRGETVQMWYNRATETIETAYPVFR